MKNIRIYEIVAREDPTSDATCTSLHTGGKSIGTQVHSGDEVDATRIREKMFKKWIGSRQRVSMQSRIDVLVVYVREKTYSIPCNHVTFWNIQVSRVNQKPFQPAINLQFFELQIYYIHCDIYLFIYFFQSCFASKRRRDRNYQFEFKIDNSGSMVLWVHGEVVINRINLVSSVVREISDRYPLNQLNSVADLVQRVNLKLCHVWLPIIDARCANQGLSEHICVQGISFNDLYHRAIARHFDAAIVLFAKMQMKCRRRRHYSIAIVDLQSGK